ncbi:MAG: sulfite exporter TauE/SafE family protein, partial [Candidatus Lokiarchaeota archaeon]|nr:sulfite exporter TauE/SafE family protein [Candidatus Lokiarchaeota archaeon]
MWILVVLFCSMFIGAAFGFGDALILIPFLTLIEGVSVQASVVLATYWGILLNVMNIVKYRGFLDKPFLKKTIPIGLAGTILGSLLISIAPVEWIELVLGSFIAIYVAYKARVVARSRLHVHGPLANGWLYTGAASYGFLGGLIGASGPIFVVVLERTNHEREAFIANFAFNSFILTMIKVGIYAWTGLFPVDLWLIFL